MARNLSRDQVIKLLDDSDWADSADEGEASNDDEPDPSLYKYRHGFVNPAPDL